MAKRAVIYARLATEDQAKHDDSMSSQLEASREYAKERGWKIVGEVTDEGASGVTLDRAGLNRIRDMAEAGQMDIVVIHKLDRLSRRVAHLLAFRRSLPKPGWKSTILGIRQLSDAARLVKTIRAAIGEI